MGDELTGSFVSRRPPISLCTIVARAGGYTYDAEVWALSLVQGPFSVAPCQTLRYNSQLGHRCYVVTCERDTVSSALYRAGVWVHASQDDSTMDGRSANHSQSNGFHTQSQEPGAEHAGRLTEPGCPRWVLAVVAGVGRRLRAAADVRRRRRRRWLRGHGQPGVVRVHAQRLDAVQRAGAVAARRCWVRFLHRQHRAETPSCNTQRTAGLVALARVDSHPHAHAREGEGGRRELR